MSWKDKRNAAACHKMVREVALALCHETYDTFMQNDQLYHGWQAQNPGLTKDEFEKVWVNKNWPDYIPAARATMAQMLSRPLDEDLKEQISEALILDASLIKGRRNAPEIVGRM